MWARAGAALCGAVMLIACQPFGGPGATPTPRASGALEPALGAPVSGLPRSLGELLTRGQLVAEEWQDEPVLSEVEIQVDAQGQWIAARLVYLAADADRFLALETSGGGFTQQRPTLSTLQLQPVTAAGIASIPALPEDAAAAGELVQSPAVDECGIGAPTTVLYATGAPVAWDGASWTSEPQWRATLSDGTAAAAVDVASGALDRCLE